MSAREYTIFFAWVEPDTPWDISLARMDEAVFDMVLEHEENQIPFADIEIKNPRIGLISPTRQYWAWISFSVDACPPQPLMLGRLVGIPDEIEQNVIRLKLICRDTDYTYQKQRVAQSLKTLPNYDPLFFEVAKRDDPDAILEGWAASYHVDRVTGRVSASDHNVGEDGTVVFAAEDVFHDSFKSRIVQVPLKAISLKMEVQWKQQYRGHIPIGGWSFPTLGGDAFVGDWPKSGSQLGGGWNAGISWAGERDASIADAILKTFVGTAPQINYTWTNKEKEHTTGDTMSVSMSATDPPPGFAQIQVKATYQPGFIDEFAVDKYGDPDPVNIPYKGHVDYFCYRTFALNFMGKESVATLGLVYNADRLRTERLETILTADTQPVMTDPDIIEETEEIVLKSGDLSMPLIEMLNWTSVGFGGTANVGMFIFPDDPRVPGQTSSQVCVQGGATGDEQPIFSNIAGVPTMDNEVIWVSLGDTSPVEGAQDWIRLARVPLGTLLIPKPVSGVPDMDSALMAGTLNYPPTGIPVAKYTVYSYGWDGPGMAMAECISAGMLGGLSAGEHADFRSFVNPSGRHLYIAIQAGTTGQFHTSFDLAEDSQTADGSVIWQNIGEVNVPIGGWPGQTPAPSYFPGDRGLQSLLHGYCRGRAKLRKRARAMEIRFDTRFEVAAQLSCRMNGRVDNINLPGGTAWGKVVSYKIEAHGSTGQLIGRVVLGVSVGKNQGHEERDLTDPGDPCYAAPGYMQRGYQRYYSTNAALTPGDPDYVAPGTPAQTGVAFQEPPLPVDWPELPPTLPHPGCPALASPWDASPPILIAGDVMGYTPPIYEPVDDGLTFPLSRSSAVLESAWHGKASTVNPLNLELYNLQLAAIIHNATEQAMFEQRVALFNLHSSLNLQFTKTPWYEIQVAVQTAVLNAMLEGSGLWYELVLKPVNNGPFMGAYVVATTELMIEQGIDLSAPSLGG